MNWLSQNLTWLLLSGAALIALIAWQRYMSRLFESVGSRAVFQQEPERYVHRHHRHHPSIGFLSPGGKYEPRPRQS